MPTLVTSMSNLFRNKTSFNSNIGFDTSNVTNMSGMFYMHLPLIKYYNWNVSSVTNMFQMFQVAPAYPNIEIRIRQI